MLLSLVMILKNEAASIRDVLLAAKPYVDRWTILDTGSTDGTQEIVKEVMAELPGHLYEESFQGFANSRNRVMALDSVADAEFQLMLSGDEYLRDGDKLRETLESTSSMAVDCYFIRVNISERNESTFQARVFRTGSSWRFDDAGCGVHEFASNKADPAASTILVTGAFIDHVVADADSRVDAIWEVHVPLLEQALVDNPHNARALQYLAQSYATHLEAMEPWQQIEYGMRILGLYLRRLALPFDSEVERAYIHRRYFETARLVGIYSPQEFLARAKKFAETDPNRPETALLLVEAAIRTLPAAASTEQIEAVYQMAVKGTQLAAEFARDGAAAKFSAGSPINTSCRWRLHLIAAGIANKLSKDTRESDLSREFFTEAKEEHVEAGLSHGGDYLVFQVYLEGSVSVADAAEHYQGIAPEPDVKGEVVDDHSHAADTVADSAPWHAVAVELKQAGCKCGAPFIRHSHTVGAPAVGHSHVDNCAVRVYVCAAGHDTELAIQKKCPILTCTWKGSESCRCHPSSKVKEWPATTEQQL